MHNGLQQDYCRYEFHTFDHQVDRLEVVNKRYVKVVFSPGKTPVDGVSSCLHTLNILLLDLK